VWLGDERCYFLQLSTPPPPPSHPPRYQGITDNPIYTLATSANIATVVTSYDNFRWYNGPTNIDAPGVASTVSAAQMARIDEIQTLITAAVVECPGHDLRLTLTFVHPYKTA